MKKLLLILSMLAFVGASGQISQTFKNVTVNDTLKTASDSMLLVKAHLVPTSDSSLDLGNDSLRWDTVFCDVLDANTIIGLTLTFTEGVIPYANSAGQLTEAFDANGESIFLFDTIDGAQNGRYVVVRYPSTSYGGSFLGTYSGGSGDISYFSGNARYDDGTGNVEPFDTAGQSAFFYVQSAINNTNTPIMGMTRVSATGTQVPVVQSYLDTFVINEDVRIKGQAYITQTPAIAVGAAGVSFLVTDATTQVQSMPFQEGVYVPVDSAGSNVDSVTPDTAFYTRVGNVVTVSGVVEIDPTTTLTPTFFYMNVPVFPANWNTNRAGGTFAAYIVNESGGIIMGGPTSVIFQYNPTATGANNFSYTYSYRIE